MQAKNLYTENGLIEKAFQYEAFLNNGGRRKRISASQSSTHLTFSLNVYSSAVISFKTPLRYLCATNIYYIVC